MRACGKGKTQRWRLGLYKARSAFGKETDAARSRNVGWWTQSRSPVRIQDVVDDVLFQVAIGQRKAAALRLVALRADGIMGRGHLSQHKGKKIDDGLRKRKQQADLTLRPEIGNWEKGK
jgi:hypothetical protein